MAPFGLRKIGPGFDLPLAIALLVASGQLDARALAGCAVVGELGLEGDVRSVRGALAAPSRSCAATPPLLTRRRSRSATSPPASGCPISMTCAATRR